VDIASNKKQTTKNTIFIGNLHYDTTEEELREFFSGKAI
jgi:RNA recognition motif-containing protein